MSESESESVFNNHFGAIITGVVSLCAVAVSLTQVWVASIDKDKELELLRLNAVESRSFEEVKTSREWKLDLAKFMAEYRSIIFSETKEGKEMQQIMLATFPPKVTYQVFGSLTKISKENSYWLDAKLEAKSLYRPRVKIFYEKSFPDSVMDAIADTIAEGDIEYDYSDQKIPKGLTLGDVRYFHAGDKQLAIQVREEFMTQACYEGYKIKLKLIPLLDSKLRAPKGTVELWLSGKSVVRKVSDGQEC